MVDLEDGEEITAVKVERDDDDGAIVVTFGDEDFVIRLTEDDCSALSRGLAAVVLNNPAKLTVHLENDDRSAHLEYL